MAEPTVARPTGQFAVASHPIYGMLLPVPVVCFVGALITDVSYLRSDGVLVWLAFSTWLLLVGLLAGVVAGIVLLVDILRVRAIRTGPGWAHALLFGLALVVETANNFIHQRDGWTAVAGPGLILSVVGAVLVILAGWLHRPAMEIRR